MRQNVRDAGPAMLKTRQDRQGKNKKLPKQKKKQAQSGACARPPLCWPWAQSMTAVTESVMRLRPN